MQNIHDNAGRFLQVLLLISLFSLNAAIVSDVGTVNIIIQIA